MNDFLKEMVTSINDVHKKAFDAGKEEGYRQGYIDGLEKAKEIIKKETTENKKL